MSTKEKPKSWAVWNDGSQEFDDVVLKYINENFARNWEGDCDFLFYGVDTEQNPMVSEYSIHFENILSLNEFCEIFLGEKKEPNIDAVEEKQSAVEWLVSKLNKEGFALVVTQEEIEQAKAMEKEQIKDAIKLEIKLIGNYFDVGKLDVSEHTYHIRFNNLLKDRYNYYNQY